MNYKPIYITTLLLLFFLSGRAQKIEELTAVPLQIGYEKTLHLIFPTEVKYYSIGGDYVIGEKVVNCPGIIRLKAAEENFPGETTLSVVTADTKVLFVLHQLQRTSGPELCAYRRRSPHTAYAAGRKRKAAVPDLPCRYHLRRLRKHERGGGQGRGGG